MSDKKGMSDNVKITLIVASFATVALIVIGTFWYLDKQSETLLEKGMNKVIEEVL